MIVLAKQEISPYADKYWLRTDKGFFEEYGYDYEPVMFDNHFYEDYTYVDNDGVVRSYPRTGQGPAKLATDEDIQRDDLGFTSKNLHRRIDPKDPIQSDNPYNQELQPRQYTLSINGVNSYRTTTVIVHDEEQTDIEIP